MALTKLSGSQIETPVNISGSVGIGTTSPTVSGKVLQVYGNAEPASLSIQAWEPANNRDASIELLSSGNGGAVCQLTFGDTDLSPFTPSSFLIKSYSSGVSTERVRISSSGNVGINTTVVSTATGTQFGTAKLNVYANSSTNVDAGVRGIAVGIAGSTRMGSALNVAFTGQQYFTQSGLDIMVGDGGYVFNIWDDNLLTRPRVMVNREGRVGINSVVVNNPNNDYYLSVVGDDSVPAAGFFRPRVDEAAIVQFFNRSNQLVFVPQCDGNVSVPIGNVLIGTSGKGISFAADAHAAGMTSELLDDYEEGTFTIGVSGSGSPAVTFQQCNYIKVGNLVTCNIRVAIKQSTATGTQTIINLPFATTNTTNYAAIGKGFWSNSATSIVELVCRMTANSSNMAVYRATGAVTTLTQWQGADWQAASDTDWDFTITYRTD